MAGWHAFPGGAAEPGDGGDTTVTARRELHEETGIDASARALVYAGRWVTPPLSPLRFDNRFYLAEWPSSEREQPCVEPGELEGGEWIEPATALERWRSGDVLAAPPVLHILRVLASDGPVAGLGRLIDPREADVGPFRRIEFRPGVLVFPLATMTRPPATHTNAVVLGRESAVLVDPGASEAEEIEKLLLALADARYPDGVVVRAIWLTHHHPDHVGGVEAARRALKVPVLAHPWTAERLRDRSIAVDGVLEDGASFDVGGGSWGALHTPGHAPGHLCFFRAEDGTLIAGDLLTGFGTVVIDPPEGSMEDYLASLERLAALPIRTLIPAHGPAVLDGSRRLRETREHRLWRESRVLAAWRDGLREPAEMLGRVYDDVPKEALALAERQIVAHLERLRAHGALE
jgi:glyoxylase-like metal-dependent hydrolase (beta-lactamase superfamily II)